MKKTFALTLTVAALALPSAGFAQFGNMLGGMTGSKPAAGAQTGADMGAQQDQLIRTYLAAAGAVLQANTHLAAALGIQAQAVDSLAASNSLTSQQIEEQDKAISANAAAVSEAMKSGATLKDAAAKAKYAQGLLALATGVKQYMDMGKAAGEFSSGLSGASLMQVGKLQTGAYIVKTLPGNVSNLTSTLKSAVDFARSNGVEVPKDATSLL